MNISSPLVNDVRFILLRDEAVVISVSKKVLNSVAEYLYGTKVCPKL